MFVKAGSITVKELLKQFCKPNNNKMTGHMLQKLPPEGSQPTARLSTRLCQGTCTPSTSSVNFSIYFRVISVPPLLACLIGLVLCAARVVCWSGALGKYSKPRIPSLSSTTKNLPLLSTAPHRKPELTNTPSLQTRKNSTTLSISVSLTSIPKSSRSYSNISDAGWHSLCHRSSIVSHTHWAVSGIRTGPSWVCHGLPWHLSHPAEDLKHLEQKPGWKMMLQHKKASPALTELFWCTFVWFSGKLSTISWLRTQGVHQLWNVSPT